MEVIDILKKYSKSIDEEIKFHWAQLIPMNFKNHHNI